MTCLGLGNGAVFQLVPSRFRIEVGLATGIVGAFGGVGGFFLPTLLGSVKQVSGTYRIGFIVLALLALVVSGVLRLLVAFHKGWHIEREVSVMNTSTTA
jgi:NNP family nitrate/nitrite transporter-like MFS transporter